RSTSMRATSLIMVAFALMLAGSNHDDSKEHPMTKFEKQAKGSRPAKPRIEPVSKEAWNDQQREMLEPMERAGRLYNVFKTMANHPPLANDWLTFGGHVLRRNTLSPREREMVILRIGWLCKAEYEWGQHVRIGKQSGLTDDDIKKIMAGPDAEGLP